MTKIYNFSAGPAILPQEVLRRAASEMTNYKESGISVMEMSHRSSLFEDILNGSIEKVSRLLNIPDNYQVLFLQGGGSTQFAMVPLNLMKNKKADYIVTGAWAKKAAQEAGKFGDVKILASSEDKNFSYIPDCSDLDIREDSDYVHYCSNNTIYGTRFNSLPNSKGKTLVTDASSCIVSEPMDLSAFGLVYAGAQKNMGPAGATMVIIRKDLIPEETVFNVPTMLSYKTHAEKNSLYNTPPSYSIYIMGLVFDWLLELGGLDAIQKINQEKAGLLYEFLDNSKLFSSPVRKEDRSLMNIPFITGDKEVDAEFIKFAADEGLISLKGHRSVGGMRASIYNAMPIEGVKKLVECMDRFERNHQ